MRNFGGETGTSFYFATLTVTTRLVVPTYVVITYVPGFANLTIGEANDLFLETVTETS